jgi:hypothetical protein
MLEVTRSAKISEDGTYRYWLSRRWGKGASLPWIMLNPSTADHIQDDPTIRRVIYFSKRLGAPGAIVLNLFALRTPDRHEIRRHPDPVGPKNDKWLAALAAVATDKGMPVMCAWGSSAPPARVHEVLEGPLSLAVMICLGTSRDDHPRHPLYLPNNQPIKLFGVRK